MPSIFFVSSIGDTELAKATIRKLLETKSQDPIYIVPLTTIAQDRINDLSETPLLKKISLSDITKEKNILLKKQLILNELKMISEFIAQKNIDHAYIGVPSPVDEEIPFQIAQSLKIPHVIAYEYMFSAPSTHKFWKYLDPLASNSNSYFAVPLARAKNELTAKNKDAKINVVGHLSIDRALIEDKLDKKSVRKSLLIDESHSYVFISSTTQPVQVDMQFIEALLKEIATGLHPNIQLRLGLHPGIKDLDQYINQILTICTKYPGTKDQFKIILSPVFKSKLAKTIESEFILVTDVSGPAGAESADHIGQAVPGALLNEGALKGKPVYFHEKSSNPYLPESFFSKDIKTFFNAKPGKPCARDELELKEDTPSNMVNLMKKFT